MKIERVEIESHAGTPMAAELDLPDDGNPKYYAIYIPCFTCPKNIRVLKNISKQLVSNGVAVLRFDFPGLGESEGDFSETNYSTNLQNIENAAIWLEENYEAPKLGIGHSMGGSAIIKFAQTYDPIKAVATLAAPSSPDHLSHVLSHIVKKANKEGSANITIGGTEFTLTKEFFENLAENADNYDLSKLKKPILVMHSPDDDTVKLGEAKKIIDNVGGHRSYVTLNNYGHLVMDEDNARNVSDIICSWAQMYL